MCHTVPFTSRSRVVRRLTASTVPLASPASDDVADPVLVLDQHEGSGDEVLDQALRAEAEGNRRCRRRRSGAEGDAQLPQDHDAGDGPHDALVADRNRWDRVVARAADLSD